MHPLNTHIQHKSFGKSIPTVKAKVSPLTNVFDDNLFYPLTCISEFNHVDHMMSVIKMVKKLAF